MERQTVILPLFCGDIIIHFVLNINEPLYLVPMVPIINHTPRPKYYGELVMYRMPPRDNPNPPTLLKRYNFADNFIQIDPELRRITAKNFIAFLERIISILERIIYNNENPWLMLVTPTSESQSHPYYVNLKTNQTFWDLEGQDRRIHPWTNHADPHGRSYYVNSLMNETVWSIQYQGEEEPYLNTVLKQIIKCLRDINSNPDPIQLQMVRLIRETKIRYREEKILNKKITRVFIIAGHSMCGRRKFEIKDPRMCVMTLSKLNDLLIVSPSGISIFFSNILQTLQNPNSNIRSFMDVARFIRDKKIEHATKDQKDSIRVRCSNDGNLKTTFTDQIFFGSSKEKYFLKEGVFMLTREDVSPQDISMQILTPNPMKHLYTETTEFQKRIIGFESQFPESSFDDLKKHFESESTIFEQEWRNLQRQRMLFCISLNYSEKIIHTVVDGLCRGIDVMELQHYYDCIIEWENKNNKCAFDYFEDNEGGIIEFMNKYSISTDKKMEGKLMLLSYVRKQQLDYNMTKRMKKKLKTSQYTDFQKIPSSYERKSCDEILQKIHADYPEENKLVIFHGCRTIDDEEGDPYHSENEEGGFVDTGGGAKRNYKNKRKNTSKKNKKINKNKNKKKNSIRIKK